MVRGPSGGGKTTFLNMVGTIDSPSSGKYKFWASLSQKNQAMIIYPN